MNVLSLFTLTSLEAALLMGGLTRWLGLSKETSGKLFVLPYVVMMMIAVAALIFRCLNGKANEEETIEVSGGIGKEILKEEWRDGIVGNLFYPNKPGKFKPIIHLNGSVQLRGHPSQINSHAAATYCWQPTPQQSRGAEEATG